MIRSYRYSVQRLRWMCTISSNVESHCTLGSSLIHLQCPAALAHLPYLVKENSVCVLLSGPKAPTVLMPATELPPISREVLPKP